MNLNHASLPLKKYIFSFMGAFLVTLILGALLCIIFSFFPPGEKLLEILNGSSGYFSAFLAAIFCARLCGKRGFLTGMVCSDIYMTLLFLCGIIFFSNSYDFLSILKIFAASSLCGAVGGIIGINCK